MAPDVRRRPASAPRAPRFDGGRHRRAAIGFVLLAMEQTVESDMARHAPEGVGVHFARAPMANRVTVETLAAMKAGIGEAAGRILPDKRLDAICYACTSGSVVIGEENVFAELRRGAPGAKATSLVTGVMRALRALGAARIAVATPYLDEINRIEADYMTRRGFEILDIQGLDIADDADMARVAPDYLLEFAAEVDRPEAEAVFISCGALRSMEIVETLEARIGKPAVTSNQAMLWDCLRLAGVDDRLDGLGRLFREH